MNRAETELSRAPTVRQGPWRLCRRRLELECHVRGRRLYGVPLDRCRTSAEVADWIFQISSKTWATDAVLAGLVRALRTLLDPQATLCSFGEERGPIDVEVTLDHVAAQRTASQVLAEAWTVRDRR